MIGDTCEGFIIVPRYGIEPLVQYDLFDQFFAKYSAAMALTLRNIRLETLWRSQELERRRQSEEVARALQDASIPLKDTDFKDLDISVARRLDPAPGITRLGGDFYDVFAINDHLIGLMIGDISGHGLSAAAYNAMIRSSMRALGLQNFGLSEVMEATNNHVISEMRGSFFVTAVYGVLDIVTGDLELCIAGHPQPLIFGKDGLRAYDAPQNPMLGFLPNYQFESYHLTLGKYEALVLYTDGLTEAHNEQGEEFGLARVIDVLTHKKGATPDETTQTLFTDITDFCGSKTPSDDRAILIIRRNRAPRGADPASQA